MRADGTGLLGMVQDGSICTNGGLCLQGVCVDMSVINNITCPVDGNGLVCSGNGVRCCALCRSQLLVAELASCINNFLPYEVIQQCICFSVRLHLGPVFFNAA
jgi:hypothetical protein